MDSMNMTDSGSMGSNSTMSSNSTASDSSMSMAMMSMYLHFTPGDTVLFDTIAPSSGEAIFGACLIFFLISVFYCWLRAFRRGVEMRCTARARRLVLRRVDSEMSDDRASISKGGEPGEMAVDYPAAPHNKFILSNELARGVLNGADTTLHYLLMLVAMTFNASYIISIIAGSVVGEVAFGRLNRG
ncbi:uncharacterized protein PHACADRAFT_251128 [Phanerochaete carnosa HHB-10118-sp]|uniref:Copper transport protein n=1 Tax=Phanerochaete carnosa (strain HHB-10118-sp) TaxID=650164 RepID=K5W0W5_PHACS|nr:uncharacterized protein PHACADRAFT_251128 [Phanerochaete carnosa HHB-10118-sp]EKM57468.1 hypothetical protein PHACADRAFT_251128 [Phanerochaete carnosa HHB-10118-sp]